MKYDYQLTLRLPTEIAEPLKKRATEANRSLNAEILEILKLELNEILDPKSKCDEAINLIKKIKDNI